VPKVLCSMLNLNKRREFPNLGILGTLKTLGTFCKGNKSCLSDEEKLRIKK
jgi:hypothetical protein